jgi:hypothetical protein
MRINPTKKRLLSTEDRAPVLQRYATFWYSPACCFTANGLQSRPSRRADAPSGLPPTPQLVWAELSNFPASRRSRFRSIANNRSSKRILAPVPPSGFRCGLGAELSSPKPHELAPSLSLPAWSLSSLLSLALLRSRLMTMALTSSTGKGFSSSYAPLQIRFASNRRLYQKSKPYGLIAEDRF